MINYNIDLSKIKNYMKNVYLVLKILEIHQSYIEKNLYYNSIIVTNTLLDMIDNINFIYIKDGLEPSEDIKKIGYLLNLEVYLDPSATDNVVIFNSETDEKIHLNVKI